jgi:IS30 family transposase
MKKTDPYVVSAILKFHDAGLSLQKIADMMNCAKTTVHDILKRGEKEGVNYQKALELGVMKTAAVLYPPKSLSPSDEAIVEKYTKLLEDPYTNRMKLWKEYMMEFPDGIQYSQFCMRIKKLARAAEVNKTPGGNKS